MSAKGLFMNVRKRKGTDNYKNKDVIKYLANYVSGANGNKKEVIDWTGFGVDNEASLSEQVEMVNNIQKINGIDSRGGRRAAHYSYSIKEDQFLQFGCNPQLVSEAFREMGRKIYEDGYQLFMGSHYNTPDDEKEEGAFMHAHFAMSSINYMNGKKFHLTDAEKHEMNNSFNQILDKYQQMSPVTFSNLDAFIQTDSQYRSLYKR